MKKLSATVTERKKSDNIAHRSLTCTDGDAEVGLSQRGRVVDAVPHHRDELPLCLQLLHLRVYT
jgi:hypothetical protein